MLQLDAIYKAAHVLKEEMCIRDRHGSFPRFSPSTGGLEKSFLILCFLIGCKATNKIDSVHSLSM